MGDFSRDTFDRLKHYVGVRLQQGVPLLDADWNETDDIRRYEVQAFLKWFVGDGVPAGNDGFRIAPLAGGGVNTVRLASRSNGPGVTSVAVDVAGSTAAAALGFTATNRQVSRPAAPALLTGDATQPFALTVGMTLKISADGAAPQTVTFTAAGFANIGAATAAEVVAVINAAATRVAASAGPGNDFVITGGDGTADGAGRCLVDGRDAVHEGRLTYTSQPLFVNPALAAAWDVPALPVLTAPQSFRVDLVFLDLWDREVRSNEDDSLVNPNVGVETAVRLRREWTVRVREGSNQLPAPGNSDHRPGHSYLPLAFLIRPLGVPTILTNALTDLRARNLFMPPSTIVEDMLGVSAASYRQGQNRPTTNLRAAINALLSGQLPGGAEISVSPDGEVDTLGKASVVDQSGGLVAIWQSSRTAVKPQILAARLDPARPEQGFVPAPAITGGSSPHHTPAAVALPNGELVVAYQEGAVNATAANVLLKQATLSGLGAAPEREVAATPNVTDQGVRAALAGDQVVFFTQVQNGNDRQWFFRRYQHTRTPDPTFIDNTPVGLSAVVTGLPALDLHAASAGGVVWVGYADGTRLQVLRMNPVTANPQASPTIDLTNNFPAAGTLSVFVVAISATEAVVCYKDGTGLSIATCANGVWTTAKVPETDATDDTPAAVRDADGNLFLFSTHPGSGGGIEVRMRRRNAGSRQWNVLPRPVSDGSNTFTPHALRVPGFGLWLLWSGIRTGDLDVYARQLITSI